jgi:hypothetical protein
MLDFYINNDEPKEFLQWKANTKKKVNLDSIGRYKKILTRSELDEFEEGASECLVKFKYL